MFTLLKFFIDLTKKQERIIDNFGQCDSILNQCNNLAIFDPRATKNPAIIANTIISILLLFDAFPVLDG